MKSRLATGFALLSACMFLAVSTACATTVTVGCSGGQPGQFNSIAAAIGSLDVIGPHTIYISGTCTESLFIGDHDSLTLASIPGQTAVLNAIPPTSCCNSPMPTVSTSTTSSSRVDRSGC